MNQPVTTMLCGLYATINEYDSNRIVAWDHMMEFIAAYYSPQLLLEFKTDFSWLIENTDLCNRIKQLYDPKLLQQEKRDHLGEMYLEKLVSSRKATDQIRSLDDKGISALLGETVSSGQEKKYTFLDPAAGTGRLLMTVHERAPNAIIFGVEADLRALRVAYTNFAIHGIKGYLLHADSTRHETDISTVNGKANWSHANKWYSQMDKLLPLQETSQK